MKSTTFASAMALVCCFAFITLIVVGCESKTQTATSAQAAPSDQDIADAYAYLLGR